MEILSEQIEESILSQENNSLEEENFKKILELEKNKNLKKLNKENKKNNNVKELILLFSLSLVFNNNHFDLLIKNVPYLDNEYLLIFIKAAILTVFFYLTKFIIA